jgi:hypothetical protein
MALGLTQPPIQWVPEGLSLGIKRPWREADYSPPSSAEVKEWVELFFHSRGAQGQLYLLPFIRSLKLTKPCTTISSTVDFVWVWILGMRCNDNIQVCVNEDLILFTFKQFMKFWYFFSYVSWIGSSGLFRFRIPETMNTFIYFGRSCWTGDRPIARPLLTQDSTKQNKRGHITMFRVGF